MRTVSRLMAAVFTLASFVLPANAQGEWTRCTASDRGVHWNIVNGQSDRDTCFALARRCTGNPNVAANYRTPAAIIRAPYRRCTLS